MATDGRVTLTWMDGSTEEIYGHVRILDTGSGVLQVFEDKRYGPDEVKISVPMVNLRSRTVGDR